LIRQQDEDDEENDDDTPKKRKRVPSASSGNGGGGSSSTPSGGKRKRRSQHNNDDEDDIDFEDIDFEDEEQIAASQARYKSNAWKTTSRTRSLMGLESDPSENPLPGHVDPITLEEVVQPAISPYGHVMSMASWIQCLLENERCPLTKKPLKRSDLVVLTKQNIDRFRDKIVAL